MQLSQRGDKEVLKRSIVFSSIRKPNENPHLEKDEAIKTAFFVYLIKKKKHLQSTEFLKLHDPQLNIHHFYLGLDYFMKGQYSKAKEELEKYDEAYLKYHKKLLLADCLYEQKGYSSREELISAYQKVLDAATSDLQASVVKNRIKYIIYKK